MNGFVFLTLASLVLAAYALPDTCLIQSESKRSFCGEETQDACEKRNCCFDPDAQGKKAKCYHPMNRCEMPSPACANGAECVHVVSVDSDGNVVLDGQYECACPPGFPEDANCRISQGDCAIEAESRVACGKVTMFADQESACLNRGCCFNDSVDRVKWCFQPIIPALPQCSCSAGGAN